MLYFWTLYVSNNPKKVSNFQQKNVIYLNIDNNKELF